MNREKQLMLLHIQQMRWFERLEHQSEILSNRFSHATGRPCVGQQTV